jgi:hypothetical protein
LNKTFLQLTNMSSSTDPVQTGASPAQEGVPGLGSRLEVESALTQALPVPDMVFGGTMLVVIVMFHAFWIRLISGSFLKRSSGAAVHAKLWRADLLFAFSVVALLSLHMAEIFLWSAALVSGHIVDGWAKASFFAANCYTALGEPFALPHAWRLIPPIIAISGIFTFAWTASVLVNFVARYNDLRAQMIDERERRTASRPHPP